MRNVLKIAAPVFGILFFSSVVYAESSASETVSAVVSKVRSTVVDQQDSLSSEEMEEKLREIIEPVFDFRTMARSSLARHWNDASPEEQEEFVTLFSELLARTYLRRIRENAAESTISVVGERKAGGDKVLVSTSVKYEKDQSAAINYRMRQKDNSWLVYDVIIENIGLVSNYRQEFDGIVRREKVSGLIERLRQKS
jgi:phospholipid transport system substrate-binding protein